MSQENLIKMKCEVCKKINYFTTKNKKTVTKPLSYKKYCGYCRKHANHKESKK